MSAFMKKVRHYSNACRKYDAVIIGGGHNGLVAAAYLQKSGRKVCVLERRGILGGAAVTEEIIPGFKFSRASYVLSLFRPQIAKQLKLEEFGLRVIPRDPSSYTPLRTEFWRGDARSLTLGTDGAVNSREISKFSESDANAFSAYEAQLSRLAHAIEPLLDMAPLQASNVLDGRLPSRMYHLLRDRELRSAAARLLRLGSECVPLFELLTAPPLKILRRWFESEVLIATLAMDALIGTVESPYAAGTGYVLLLHSMLGECGGGRGRWGYPVGGMGAVSQAIAASAEALGVHTMVNKTVREILLDGNGVTRGVKTSDGEEFVADLVLSNATAKVTFFDLLPAGSLEPSFEKSLRLINYSSGVTKINVAVNKLPNFLADPNCTRSPEKALPHHQTTIHINSEQVKCLEDAHQDYLQSNSSKRPLIEMTIPSVLDPSVASDKGHVVLLFTQYTPYNPSTGEWDEEAKEAYAKTVFELIDEYAPGFSDSVMGKEVLTPPDLDRIFGLTGGNIFHGSMSPDNLFLLRPSCVTPIPGLLLCGSGAHPGGGVSGAPGHIAALQAIRLLNQK